MGQYYSIVNLDKQQQVNPHEFGEGVKLLEFGSSGCGTMSGIAILMADGNGRGGGDLYHNTCLHGNIDLRKNRHLKVINEFKSGGKTCKTLVPKIAGSWAGDRVVITGDYADKGKFIKNRELNEEEKKFIKEQYPKDRWDDFKETDDLTLQQYADIHFEDISKEVVKALKFDPYLNKCLTEKIDYWK